MSFECAQCGKCCKLSCGTLGLTDEEIGVWMNYKYKVSSNYGFHFPIEFAYVIHFNGKVGMADLFFHPVTKEELWNCPFLRKERNKDTYKCLLHGTELKPKVCKDWPLNLLDENAVRENMEHIGCIGILKR